MEQTYTVEELAEKLGVHYNTANKWLKNGTIKGIQGSKGGKWFVTKSALDKFLEGK